MQFLEGPKSAITALAFAPDGERLAVGCGDGTILLATYDLQSLGELAGDRIESLTFDASGSTLLCAGKSGWFGFDRKADEMWNIHVPRGTAPTMALAFIEESILAVGTGDRKKPVPGMFELRNVATGQRLEPRFREPSGVRAIAVHGPSRTVAWTNATNGARVWPTQTLEARPLGLAHPAPALAFHPDGERLAIAQDYGVKIVDVKSLDEIRSLKGHAGRVTAVAYSPDGRQIATASWDKTVRFWDAESGACRATFDWGIGRVLCLAFAPDGLRLAAGGETGTVAICDVE